MYRLLETGEVVQEGDELYIGSSNTWAPAAGIGKRLGKGHVPFRRKVDISSIQRLDKSLISSGLDIMNELNMAYITGEVTTVAMKEIIPKMKVFIEESKKIIEWR